MHVRLVGGGDGGGDDDDDDWGEMLKSGRLWHIGVYTRNDTDRADPKP